MIETFAEFEQHTITLFNDGAYQQVLDVLTAAETQFPAEVGFNYYMRICAAARLEDIEQSCDLLAAALERELWFTENVLRESPSLAPLNGHERFEKLVKISAAGMASVMSQPVVKTAVPDTPSPHPLLLALHGNGSSVAAEFGQWQTAVSSGWCVSAPQSTTMMLPGRYYWTSAETAVDEIKTHLAEIEKEHALDSDQMMVGGFSMGGDIALWLALTHALPVKRFMLVGPGGPYFDAPETLKPLIDQKNGRSIRGMVLMSEDDPLIDQEKIRAVVRLLNEGGIACDLITYQGLGHEYPPDFHVRLTAFLR